MYRRSEFICLYCFKVFVETHGYDETECFFCKRDEAVRIGSEKDVRGGIKNANF